jgi:amino acid permease
VLPAYLFVNLPGYDPGQVQGSVGFILTVCNTMMGSTLLCLPHAFEYAGVLPGSALTLLVGMIAYYTCVLILKWGARPRHRFDDFSDLCGEFLGRWAKHVATSTSALIVLGEMACYHVLMASMLQSVAEDLVRAAGGDPRAIDFGNATTEFAVPAMITAAAVLLVMRIRDLATLARIAGFGVVAMIFNVVLLVGSGLWNMFGLRVYPRHEIGDVIYFGSVKGAGKMAGLMGLSLFVHSVLLPVAATHKHIARRPDIVKRDFGIAYCICVFIYIAVGLVPSMAFMLGNNVQPIYHRMNLQMIPQNALLAFPGSPTLAGVGKSLLVLQMVTIYPMLGAVIRRQLCMAYLKTPEPSGRTAALFNIGVAGLTTAVAAFYPYPCNVVEVVGSYTAVVYMLGLPIAVHLEAVRYSEGRSRTTVFLHVVLFFVGSIAVLTQFFLKN